VLAYGQVELQDHDDFEQKSKHGEEFVEAFVSDFDRRGAEQEAGDGAGVVKRTEGVEIITAFDERVGEVGEEQKGHESEDPAATGVEIIFEAGVVGHFFGEKEHAEKEKKNGVEGDEEIKREGPDVDVGETKFPPPEVNQLKKKK
jgi:hypothetical protein